MHNAPIYKPQVCHRCRGQLGLFWLKDTWQMRIDGVLHNVPVFAVPCKNCLACGTSVLDGTADEMIAWCRDKYLTEAGLNTWRHRLRRQVRRRILRWRDRWNLFVYRTFYKREQPDAD